MSTHRRRFLRLCGVAGLGAVAGCAGGSEDVGTPADDETPADGETTTGATGSRDQQVKLAADDGDSRDQFGRQVELSADGTTALIGSQTDDSNGENAGAAYVFENSGGSWTQQAKLTADDGDGGDAFGVSVTMSSDGSTALVGASVDEDPNGERAGSAYVFEHAGGSWTQRSKLVADDGESYDNFGDPVAMSSDGTIGLIGALFFGSFDDSGSENPGSAYVLQL